MDNLQMHGIMGTVKNPIQDNLRALLQAPGTVRVPGSLHSFTPRLPDWGSADEFAEFEAAEEEEPRRRAL